VIPSNFAILVSAMMLANHVSHVNHINHNLSRLMREFRQSFRLIPDIIHLNESLFFHKFVE